MIFELFVELIFQALNFLISIIPKIDLGGLESALDWILRTFSQLSFVIRIFNYIAGFPVIPIVFGIFMALSTIELTISIIWWILYKIHLAGGGK